VNLLVVGVSHHTAPVELLERLSIPTDDTRSVLAALVAQPFVNEAVVLSTCNRVEVYAAVTAFHGGLAEIGAVLADRAGLDVASLASHMYVHYDDDAARHALRVAAGLDSMVVGEAQILGQLRDAYGHAAEHDAAGRFLHELMQQALRVGKRVHAETGIDHAGQSVVSAAIALAPGGVAGRSALVIGAGSMGGLALATLSRAGVGRLLVTNRGADRAQRLAALHGATAVDYTRLAETLRTVDVVVCATASPEPVLTDALVRAAMVDRSAESMAASAGASARRALVLLDLAVPRDVAPDVAALPGVVLIDLARLAAASLDEPSSADREAADAIVASEVEAFLSWLRGSDVAPTVAALRARADEVVDSELSRLAQRRPDLTPDQRADVAHAIHRVVQRLLHSPTVRVRQLAGKPGGDQYAALLRELFDLAVPDRADNLTRAVDVDSDRETS
jgi:glutamyl-tRNA reductase